MDFLISLSTSSLASILACVLLLYSLLWLSRILFKTTSKKRPLPPEAGGAWPVVGHLHLLGGTQPAHLTLGRMADKYGRIFTIKLGVHRALVVSSWEIAKECLTVNDRVFANRPKIAAMEILGYNYSMLGFSPYGFYWRQVRKIATLELLSNHRLEMLKHARQSEAKAALKALHQLWVNNKNGADKVLVDMKRWFHNTTLNVILMLIVGKKYISYNTTMSFPEQGREKSDTWRDSLRKFCELSGIFVISDALPFLRCLDLGGHVRAMKKTMKELDPVIEGWLQEHKQKRISNNNKLKGHEEDFMDVMLSIFDDTEEIDGRNTDTIIKATSLALILAGSDTTTVTLTWALSLLLNNKDVLKKVQEELDIQVGRERQVEESDVKNLVYLQATIKETFRLYPAVPLSLPHESVEDCTVSGYNIPAGTRLFFNLSKIQRDDRVWIEPDKFEPERFLTTHKNVDVRGQNFQLIPFSSGRRMCPGVSFGLQVLQLTLATLLHGFEIATPFDDELIDMREGVGLTNLKAAPLEVLLAPRLTAHLYG